MEADARALAREIVEIRRTGHENLGRLLHLTDALCREVLNPLNAPTARRHALEASAVLDEPRLDEYQRLTRASASALVALALTMTDAD